MKEDETNKKTLRSSSMGVFEESPFDVDGLTPDTDYNVSVKVTDKVGKATTSDPIDFKTFPLRPIINSFMATESDPKQYRVQLTYDVTSDAGIDRIRFYANDKYIGNDSTATDNGDGTFSIVLFLDTPNTEYDIYMEVYDINDLLTTSSVIKFTTYPIPPLISYVTIAETKQTEITFDINASSQLGTIDHYEYILNDGTPVVFNSNPFTLSGLTIDTMYNIKFIAYDTKGQSSNVWDMQFATLPPAPIINSVTIEGITTTTAKIVVNATGSVNGGIDRYVYIYNGLQTSGADNTHVITSLIPYTEYTVQVKVIDKFNQATLSDEVVFKTLPRPIEFIDYEVSNIAPNGAQFEADIRTTSNTQMDAPLSKIEFYDGATKLFEYNGNSLSFFINTLFPSTTYNITNAIAFDVEGQQASLDKIYDLITSDSLLELNNIDIYDIETNSAKAFVDYVSEGDIQKIEYAITDNINDDFEDVILIEANTSELVFDNLVHRTTYKVFARVTDEYGQVVQDSVTFETLTQYWIVKFDSNGADDIDSLEVVHEDYINLDFFAQTYEGHTYNGWIKQIENNIVLENRAIYDSNEEVIGEYQLEEDWVVGETYTMLVRADINDGQQLGAYCNNGYALISDDLTYDSTLDCYKYTFVCPNTLDTSVENSLIGFFNTPATSVVYGRVEWIYVIKGNDIDTTLYQGQYQVLNNIDFLLMWKPNKYNVVFKDWDSSIISSQEVLFGHGATEPSKPVRDGYDFVGWSDDFDYITEDMEINALYEPKTYYVSFDTRVDAEGFEPLEIKYGDSIGVLPTPSFDGVLFQEWNTEPDRSGETYHDNDIFDKLDDIVLYAIYDKYPLIVRQDLENQENLLNDQMLSNATASYTSNNLITYKYVDNYNIVFAVNKFNNIPQNNYYEIEVPSNISYTNKYIFSYDYDYINMQDDFGLGTIKVYDGSSNPSNEMFSYTPTETQGSVSQVITMPSNWTGYFTIRYYINTTGVTNTTEFDVSMILNIRVDENYTKFYNLGDIINIDPIDKIGYVFDGYFKDPDFTIPFVNNVETMVQSGIEVYANWIPSAYTITLDANGGTVSPTSVLATFREEIIIPDPVRDGRTFIGWRENGSRMIYYSGYTWNVPSDKTLTAVWGESTIYNNENKDTFDEYCSVNDSINNTHAFGLFDDVHIGRYMVTHTQVSRGIGTIPYPDLGLKQVPFYKIGDMVWGRTYKFSIGENAETPYSDAFIVYDSVKNDGSVFDIDNSNTYFRYPYHIIDDVTKYPPEFKGMYFTGGLTDYTNPTTEEFYEYYNTTDTTVTYEDTIYTINFIDDGGQRAYYDTRKVVYDVDGYLDPFPVLTKEGFVFSHWEDEHGLAWDENRFPFRDLNLHPVWNERKSYAQFNANGGAFAGGSTITVQVHINDPLPEIEHPTRSNYVFSHYEDENGDKYNVGDICTWYDTKEFKAIWIQGSVLFEGYLVEYLRPLLSSSIYYINFTKNLPPFAEPYITLSEDDGIKAYVSGNKLIINCQGTIFANKQSSYMFSAITNYAPGILEINFDNFNTYNVVTMESMFSGVESVQPIDVSGFDFSNVENVSQMFNSSAFDTIILGDVNSPKLKNMAGMFANSWVSHLKCNSIDTSNVTDMNYMFGGGVNIYDDIVDFTSLFDTSKVEDASDMFRYCKDIHILDISNWDISSVRRLDGMFAQCHSLNLIITPSGVSHNIENMRNMFSGCQDLGKIDMSHFDMSNIQPSLMYGMFDEVDSVEIALGRTQADCDKLNAVDGKSSRWMFHVKPPVLNAFLYTDASLEIGTELEPSTSKELLKVYRDFAYDWSFLVSEKPSIWFDDSEMIETIEVVNNISPTSLLFPELPYWFALMGSTRYIYGLENIKELIGANSLDLYFYGCSSLKNVDLSSWDVSNVKNMRHMFEECRSLEFINTIGWDTSKVVYMSSMFMNCRALTSIDLSHWDVSSVWNYDDMFNSCENLLTYSLQNVGSQISVNNINTANMFKNCHNIQSHDLSSWIASSVYNSFDMFANNYTASTSSENYGGTTEDCEFWNNASNNELNFVVKPTAYARLYTDGTLEISRSINQNKILDVDYGDVYDVSTQPWKNERSKIKTISMLYKVKPQYNNWFAYLTNLTNINNFYNYDTSNLTSCVGMFNSCESLTSIDLSHFNTENVTDFNSMFTFCESLKEIDMSSFDFGKSNGQFSVMFRGCYVVENIIFPTDKVIKATGSNMMFEGCEELKSIDLSMFDFSSLSGGSSMFNYCTSVTSAYARTKADCDKLNATSNKPSNVNFEIKIQPIYAYLYDDIKGIVLELTTKDTPTEGVNGDRVLKEEYGNIYNISTVNAIFRPWNLNTPNIKYVEINSDIRPKYITNWFFNCYRLVAIDGLEKIDTQDVNSMVSVFDGCTMLETPLDLSSWDVSNVIQMNFMFAYCNAVPSINITGWKTNRVNTMNYMFYQVSFMSRGCEVIGINDIQTHSCVNMLRMFSQSYIKHLQLSNIDTSSCMIMNYMFNDCFDVGELNTDNWNLHSLTQSAGMFRDAQILTLGNDTHHLNIQNNIITYGNMMNNWGANNYHNMYIDYKPSLKTLAEDIVATKGNGNVFLGVPKDE